MTIILEGLYIIRILQLCFSMFCLLYVTPEELGLSQGIPSSATNCPPHVCGVVPRTVWWKHLVLIFQEVGEGFGVAEEICLCIW